MAKETHRDPLTGGAVQQADTTGCLRRTASIVPETAENQPPQSLSAAEVPLGSDLDTGRAAHREAARNARRSFEGLAENTPDISGGEPGFEDLTIGATASEEELQIALAQDLARLNAAADDIESTQNWVDQYADEATALAAIARGIRPDTPTQAGQPRLLSPSADTPKPAGPVGQFAANTPPQQTSGEKRAYDVERGERRQRSGTLHHGDGELATRNEGVRVLADQHNIEPRPGSASSYEDSAHADARIPGTLQDEAERDGPTGDLVTKLTEELRVAREELRRVREKAERQTRMYGSVGEQTRKLDRRAAELRERVTQAQKTLDERAQKLRESFGKERERLREYRTKLNQQAKDMAESVKASKAKLEERFAAKRAELEEEIARRGRESSMRENLDDQRERNAFEERKADLEREVRARIERIEHEAAVRTTDLDLRQKQLAERASALDRRSLELDKVLADQKAELQREKSEGQAQLREQRGKLTAEIEEHRKDLERAQQQFTLESDRHAIVLKGREAAVTSRETEIEKLAENILAQEDAAKKLREEVESRENRLDRRDEELARLSAALEVRERRLQEWQTRIDRAETRREELDHELDAKQAELSQLEEHEQARKAELDEESTRLHARREDVRQKEEILQARHAELEERETKLSEREKEAAYLSRELEERDAALKDERERYATLEIKAKEIEDQMRELDATTTKVFRREAALKERVDAYRQDMEDLREAKAELKESREDLDAQRQVLDEREDKVEDRIAQAVDIEARVEQAKKAQETELQRLEELQAAYAETIAAAERGQRELTETRAAVQEEQKALSLEQQRIKDERERLQADQASLAQDRESLHTAQESLDKTRADLDNQLTDLARLREEVVQKQKAAENERAKLERTGLELRDSQRAVAEEKSRLEATRREVEETRRELAKRIEETEEYRSQLSIKAERIRSRKARLAEDVATVDARLQALERELKVARDDRSELDEEKARVQEEVRSIAADREAVDRDRAELDQLRRTYQAGLREVDDGKADLAEREAKLSERAHQLEAFRNRLDEEHGELQRRQQEVLESQEETGGASEKLATLMKQVEAREEELRRRADDLNTHEKALAARSGELVRSEHMLEEREESLKRQARELEADEESLSDQRREYEAVMESEREAMEEYRRGLSAEADTEKEKLRERVARLEAKLTERDQDDDVETSAREQAVLEEARRMMERELSERLAAVEKQESEVEQRCRIRLEEVDRDIAQRLDVLEAEIKQRREDAEAGMEVRRTSMETELAQARTRFDEQIGELRQRQSSLAQEQSELRRQRTKIESSSGRIPIYSGASDDAEEHDDAAEIAETASSGETVTDVTTTGDDTAHGIDQPFDEEDVFGEEATDSADDLTAGESGSALDLALADGADVETHGGDEGENEEDILSADESVAEPGPEPARDDVAEIADQAALAVAMRDRPAKKPRTGFRPVSTCAIGLALGILAGAAYFFLSPRTVDVRGRLMTGRGEPLSESAAREHIAGLSKPAILDAASAKVGTDLTQLFYRDHVIQFALSAEGGAVDLLAKVPAAQRAQAREWIDAIGDAYLSSVGDDRTVHAELTRRRASLTADRQQKDDDLAAIEVELRQLAERTQREGQDEQIQSLRARKEQLRADIDLAKKTAAEAAAGLAAFEASPAPAGLITPSETQLAAAYASDVELEQLMKDRLAKAREFHGTLTEAVSAVQTPLAKLLGRVEALSTEAERLRAEQTDQEIRKELELVVIDLADYQEQADTYAESWDALGPKVAAWGGSGDVDVLLEYQKTAEGLIRKFHADRQVFGAAAAKIDAIGRGGSEMTKRRIVETQLKGQAQEVFSSLSEWIISAQGVLTHYNLELKALRNAIRDITPRIQERQASHRTKLSEHLTEVRSKEHATELNRLRQEAAATDNRVSTLKDALLEVDAQLTNKGVDIEALESLRAEVKRNKSRQETLMRERADLAAEIVRVQASLDVATPGAVAYESLAGGAVAMFGLGRTGISAGLGAAVFVLFVFVVWLRTRREQPAHETGSS